MKHKIIESVQQHFGVTTITGSIRRELSDPRAVVIMLYRIVLSMTFQEIADEFGMVRSAPFFAHRQALGRYQTDKNFRELVNSIVRSVFDEPDDVIEQIKAFSKIPRVVRFREPKKVLGIPLQRDPDNPCDSFEPSQYTQFEMECAGDGHELCGICKHYKITAL